MQSWGNSLKIVQKCSFLDFLLIPEGKGGCYMIEICKGGQICTL